jgi:hypothetical protein
MPVGASKNLEGIRLPEGSIVDIKLVLLVIERPAAGRGGSNAALETAKAFLARHLAHV